MCVVGANETMVGGPVVFTGVITKVLMAGFPKNMEVFLVNPVLDPVEAHVHGFGALLADSAISNAGGNRVVSLYWRRRLWPSHILECLADDGGFLGVNKEGGEFSFSSG